ncbi:MAG: ABC transporter substrate-binding protein [Alkalinema sp. CACIAM 70d]|nr:MAG: ABC transporter substrate-binding protein [Alkalinema sp. CACIAM 70d]
MRAGLCGVVRSLTTVGIITVGMITVSVVLPTTAQPTSPTPAPSVNARSVEPRSSAKMIKVATRVVPPFVIEENKRLTGFSVELWRSIASEMGMQSTFVVQPDVNQLLQTVQSRQADLGIAAVSITSDRYKSLDFSQPILESGLQILVRDESASHFSLFSVMTVFFSPALWQILGVMVLLILVPAHIVWWLERRNPQGMLSNTAYFPGIFQACWWSAATLATQADEMPKGAAARIIAVIWMFTSVVFVAYFTATVTTSLTIQQLRGTINGPEDLPNKKVATTAGSTSAVYLAERNAQVSEFPSINDAYEALLQKKVDAVVFDSPVLLYYAAREGRGKVHTVGPVFRRESYGIVFPPNSPYEKAVNEALLTLRENGTYQDLYDKWFTGDTAKN